MESRFWVGSRRVVERCRGGIAVGVGGWLMQGSCGRVLCTCEMTELFVFTRHKGCHGGDGSTGVRGPSSIQLHIFIKLLRQQIGCAGACLDEWESVLCRSASQMFCT